MNKNIFESSINCLAKAQIEDITYKIARDVTLDYIKILEEENNSLKSHIKTIKRRRKKQTSKKNKYKDRIDKATEYIEKNIELNNDVLPNVEGLLVHKQDLIKNENNVLNCLKNILKGEENE